MVLVDAHVHIYDCFDLEVFFHTAYSNFKAEAKEAGHGDDFTGILLLAETSGEQWFQHLSECAKGRPLPDGKKAGNWRFFRTDEDCSIHARCDEDQDLFLVAGQQLVTMEGLELLSLGSTDRLVDGEPVERLIGEVSDRGGTPVIPWGFGKWMGRRGAVLNELLDEAKKGDFFLGDSGNRPLFLPSAPQWKLAEERNIGNLPGSDPFPVQSGHRKVGSFGFSVRDLLDGSRPWTYLKKIIGNEETRREAYGDRMGLSGFFRNQSLLQLKRILQKRKPAEA